ncbi:hypothetical protein LEP1GSC052_3464 [Leptospira kmetyi serovar Malaysia str. Bejo-Iso9]|nr:hypothetical protein LEP1GSC052_3464 [Leptospira kmetyi serovar Malaysia str. Bejo-Iso9]
MTQTHRGYASTKAASDYDEIEIIVNICSLFLFHKYSVIIG